MFYPYTRNLYAATIQSNWEPNLSGLLVGRTIRIRVWCTNDERAGYLLFRISGEESTCDDIPDLCKVGCSTTGPEKQLALELVIHWVARTVRGVSVRPCRINSCYTSLLACFFFLLRETSPSGMKRLAHVCARRRLSSPPRSVSSKRLYATPRVYLTMMLRWRFFFIFGTRSWR